MERFKRHPTNVLRSKGKISRVHALEVARRTTEKGGGEGGEMMPLTAAEMPNPMAQAQTPQDPSSQWPAMMMGGPNMGGGGMEQSMDQLGAIRAADPGPGGGADQDISPGYVPSRQGDPGPGGGADQDWEAGYIPKRLMRRVAP